MKKPVYRIGDKVKIIAPEIFIRCGYPLTKQIALETLITDDEKRKVKELLNYPKDFGIYETTNYQMAAEDNILDALAYFKIAEKGFGGKDRKIYTEVCEEIRNQTAEIIGKKVVRSGRYNPGWYDGDEGEPPFLDQVESNVILEVRCDNWMTRWIEVKNVEKIS